MFGRASLFLVLGFSSIFLVYTANMVGTATKTVDVYTQYYSKAVADNIALSGAQLGCNAFFQTVNWNAGYSNLSLNGGTCNVTVTYPTGNIVQLTSRGTYGSFTKDIIVRFRPSNFAKFGNFYSNCAAIPATGDTLDGPIHFNDYCKVYGNPVFLGKVTCKSGLQKNYNPSNPKFLGGFESGVQIPLTINATQMTNVATSSGKLFQGTASKPYVDVDITFFPDGNIKYKTRVSSNGSSWDAWSSVLTTRLDSIAPNGVITIKKGNLTTRGTLNGKATITALADGAGTSFGNVYIDNNITYSQDPRTVPTSDDLLGLVAENSLIIPYNNSRGNMTIMASLMSQNDGLVVQSYGSYSGISNLNLFGGIIADEVKATAQYSGSTPVRGYRYVHKYDARFRNVSPPYFPSTSKYEIISWLE